PPHHWHGATTLWLAAARRRSRSHARGPGSRYFAEQAPLAKKADKVELKHYYWGGRRPKDYLLAHNPVQPVHMRQQHGVVGFGGMCSPPGWAKEANRFGVCDCGWRPDLGVHSSCGGFRKISSIDFDTDAIVCERARKSSSCRRHDTEP